MESSRVPARALCWTGTVRFWHVSLSSRSSSGRCRRWTLPPAAFVVELVGRRPVEARSRPQLRGVPRRAPSCPPPGVLIAVSGVAGAFFINGASFLASSSPVLMDVALIRRTGAGTNPRRTSSRVRISGRAPAAGRRRPHLPVGPFRHAVPRADPIYARERSSAAGGRVRGSHVRGGGRRGPGRSTRLAPRRGGEQGGQHGGEPDVSPPCCSPSPSAGATPRQLLAGRGRFALRGCRTPREFAAAELAADHLRGG